MRAWVQWTAAQGPAVCGRVVHLLLPVFTEEADRAAIGCRTLELIAGDEKDTIRSALLALEGGEGLSTFLASWAGPGWRTQDAATIQWIGRSPFRPEHRRKNWYVGLSVLSPVERGAAGWRPEEVSWSATCAGGPGGQHANTASTAVRLTHLPTGWSVIAREERSQAMNRRLAEARLAAMLRTRAEAHQADAARERWERHHALERGNPVRVYRGVRLKRSD